MTKLLVALDGSPRAEGVLNAASSLANKIDGSLVLLRATQIPGDLPVEALASDPEAVARVLSQRVRDEVRELARETPRVLDIRVELGEAWRVIDRIARDEDVDMIVIGAHGYGTLERILGTVAARVVDHADRPVLVVRDGGRLS